MFADQHEGSPAGRRDPSGEVLAGFRTHGVGGFRVKEFYDKAVCFRWHRAGVVGVTCPRTEPILDARKLSLAVLSKL